MNIYSLVHMKGMFECDDIESVCSVRQGARRTVALIWGRFRLFVLKKSYIIIVHQNPKVNRQIIQNCASIFVQFVYCNSNWYAL